MASLIIGVSIFHWTVCSGADERKCESSALLAFTRGIRQWPVNSRHKGPVTIMTTSSSGNIFCITGPMCGEFTGHRWRPVTLLWRHNGHDGVSNHHPHECLLNRPSRRRSKKTSKLRVTGLTDISQYTDVIMGPIASQINSLTIVYSTVYSGADRRKHESSASLTFGWGIHRRPVNCPHKWLVTQKMFPFNDVIMTSSRLSPVSREAWRRHEIEIPSAL